MARYRASSSAVPCPAAQPLRSRLSLAFALLAACGFVFASSDPEADASRRELRLRGATFDPIHDGLPADLVDLPSHRGLVENARRAFVVQADGLVTSTLRAALGRAGARIESALGPGGLLVTASPPVDAAALARLRGVRFAGPVAPGWTLSPALVDRMSRPVLPGLLPQSNPDAELATTTSRPIGASDAIRLDALLFRGDDPDSIARTLEARFPELRVEHVKRERGSGSPRMTVEVPERLLAPVAAALARTPVHALDLAPRERFYNDQSIWITQSYDTLQGPAEATAADPKPYAQSATVWNRGLRGEGQLIAVADTGLETSLCYFEDPANAVLFSQVTPPAPLPIDPAHRKVVVVNGTAPGTLGVDGTFRHGSHVAGSAAGDDVANPAGPGGAGHDTGDGHAPAAKILFEDIGPGHDANCIGTLVVPSIEDLLVQEAAAGAHVSTNSWGGDAATEFSGAYSSRTREVDVAAWDHPEFLVLFAAGNDGAAGFNDYAACKSCLAVGASQNHEPPRGLFPEDMATFSSHGPAADGRIKPDIVAPGDRVFSSRFRTLFIEDETSAACTAPGPSEEVCFRAPFLGGCYLAFTDETCDAHALRGTSMASPIAAAMGALARQYFTEGYWPSGAASPADAFVPSSALLRGLLVASGRNMTGSVGAASLLDAPSSVQGWGRIALDDALFFDGDARRLIVHDVAHADGPATGGTRRYTFDVVDPAEPLRIVLAWTDPPGSPMAAPALVHDLDLEVQGPGGIAYRGNQFTSDDPLVPGDKQSAVNPAGRDALNNVEGVVLDAPAPGPWSVTVVGHDVPGFLGVTSQGFGLVVAGGVGPGGAGQVPGQPGTNGPQLEVTDAGGGAVALTWGVSCVESDTDYAVYEGTLGDFTSHEPERCGNGGATTALVMPDPGSRYFLVAPRNAAHEGSLGTSSDGTPRSIGPLPCTSRQVIACD